MVLNYLENIIKDCGTNVWIQNVSRTQIQHGDHYDPGITGVLIQISDPPGDHPTPKYPFSAVHQFDFLDIEEDGMSTDGNGNCTDMSEFAITQQQADQLVEILEQAINNNQNVVVHCVAGICRSGAVCEVGVMMGFQDLQEFRTPNMLVKHKMMKSLGWLYEDTDVYQLNGEPILDSWKTDKEKMLLLAELRRYYMSIGSKGT